MIKYTKEHIEQLLARFMDGTSILEEEDVLSHYFLSEKNIPDEWLPYRDMFRELEKMKNDEGLDISYFIIRYVSSIRYNRLF